MFEFLAESLAFFYDIWPNFGGAIILFTLVIMLILTPLSIKTTRSMIAMQRVGPELKKIQAQYKDDKQRQQQEVMAFYKENNINPLSSCLPMLLQMPVFFVLYQVLIGLRRRGTDGTFDPKYLEGSDSAFAEKLRESEQMMSFGIDLSRSMMETLSNSIVEALPFVVLVGAVVGTAFVQQRQIQARNTGAVNPQQQMIGKIMPFIFIPISVSIPAGVVIYFVVSNTVRIGQQALVTRMEYGPNAEAKRDAERKAKPVENGNGKAIDAGSSEKKKTSTNEPGTPKGKSTSNGGRKPPSTNGNKRTGTPSRSGAANQSRSRKKKKRK